MLKIRHAIEPMKLILQNVKITVIEIILPLFVDKTPVQGFELSYGFKRTYLRQSFSFLRVNLPDPKLKLPLPEVKSTFIYLILIISLISGCRNSGSRDILIGHAIGKQTARTNYAEKFTVQEIGNYRLISVHAPWQNASGNSFRYLAGSDPQNIPDSLTHLTFIQTPVERAVIMSTTFISFLDTLDVLNTVKGVSGGSNIYHPLLRKRFMSNKIREVGYDHSMNYEVLVDLQPDVVFMFGVQSGIVQTIKKLEEIGIPVVICADYLEPHPLGRSEWLKFFAAFYEKEEQADRIFSGIAKQYNAIAEAASENTPQPSVLLGLPWKDTWYVAGGRSFAAQLISDAGGRYIFDDEDHAEAKPVGIEKVFMRGLEADIWMNTGVATSSKVILDHDPRFEMLEAFQNQRIYNHTKRVSPGGGNDYWESGVLRPDLVLNDLAVIFRDQQANSNGLYYYERLK
jgi:iron complex transport system substrate-binding protein